MPSYSSRNIDEEGTRAAARALYGPVDRAIHLRDGESIAGILAEGRRAEPVRLSVAPAQWKTSMPSYSPAPAPRPAPVALPTDEIEAVLRSAPQVCATCKLLSNEPLRDCTSPRGHYFVTDYAAMAAKVRAMPR